MEWLIYNHSLDFSDVLVLCFNFLLTCLCLCFSSHTHLWFFAELKEIYNFLYLFVRLVRWFFNFLFAYVLHFCFFNPLSNKLFFLSFLRSHFNCFFDLLIGEFPFHISSFVYLFCLFAWLLSNLCFFFLCWRLCLCARLFVSYSRLLNPQVVSLFFLSLTVHLFAGVLGFLITWLIILWIIWLSDCLHMDSLLICLCIWLCIIYLVIYTFTWSINSSFSIACLRMS
jgi:hypothetical protein